MAASSTSAPAGSKARSHAASAAVENEKDQRLKSALKRNLQRRKLAQARADGDAAVDDRD